jgi:cysteine synthase
MIDLAVIEAAAQRLDGIAVRTPLIRNDELDRIAGGRVLVKAENLQAIGSFKIRGAYNLMSQLSPDEAARGVVAFSSGNHAQGVALAGRLLGIHAAIQATARRSRGRSPRIAEPHWCLRTTTKTSSRGRAPSDSRLRNKQPRCGFRPTRCLSIAAAEACQQAAPWHSKRG